MASSICKAYALDGSCLGDLDETDINRGMFVTTCKFGYKKDGNNRCRKLVAMD